MKRTAHGGPSAALPAWLSPGITLGWEAELQTQQEKVLTIP